MEMVMDPMEEQVGTGSNNSQEPTMEFVDTVKSSQQWVNGRHELAMNMYYE